VERVALTFQRKLTPFLIFIRSACHLPLRLGAFHLLELCHFGLLEDVFPEIIMSFLFSNAWRCIALDRNSLLVPPPLAIQIVSDFVDFNLSRVPLTAGPNFILAIFDACPFNSGSTRLLFPWGITVRGRVIFLNSCSLKRAHV